MDSESLRKFLERDETPNASTIDSVPAKFLEPLVLEGLTIDLIERGRIICSMKIPPRLLNTGNSMHGGAIATLVDVVGSAVIYTVGAPRVGVSVEINVSYLDAAYAGDEIEIQAKALRVGKAVAVISVEFRKKKTGKIIAQGRHTKYLAVSSKM